MLNNHVVYLNGKFEKWEKATVNVLSHSFSRGSAIFEVLSFHKTGSGPAAFRLDEYIHRLFRSAELLHMDIPLSKEAALEAVLSTVKNNRLTEGLIKIFCYASEPTFKAIPPKKPLDICIVAVDRDHYFGENNSSPSKGLSACICKWRKLHPETVPIEAKVAANYLNGMVALQEANARGFDMGIMLDTEGFFAEGSTESTFIVKDGVLMTPILGTVLQGITRKSILEAADHVGIKVVQKRLRQEIYMEADEIFVTASSKKIQPLKRINDRTFTEAPGPVAKKLSTLFEKICSGDAPRFKNWLFPVDGPRR